MSGVEAIAVSGVISSIISIVDGTKKVYDAATDARGLPEAFRKVASQLPIIRHILDSAKQHIDDGGVDEDSCKGVKPVVEACEKKAEKLDTLFQKAIPQDGTRGLERNCKAAEKLRERNEVLSLMIEMLEGVRHLACERGIKTANKAQQDQIVEAVSELLAVLASVPEDVYQDTGLTNTNTGSGTQYNAKGENVAQGNARQFNSAGGGFKFGLIADEAAACLAALFLTDPKNDREQLIQAKGSRVVGTCEWIKSNDLYNSWLHSGSQLLWLSGGPGKGKTMISIFLAEELEQTAKDSQDILFLQYFCDNKDEKRNTAITIIRGLIFQLLQSQKKNFDHILPSFNIQKESLFAGSSFETLWRIFESMVYDPVLGTTYCVLDGLDECNEASLEVLLKKFAALFSTKINGSSVCHLNLIVVSRDLPDFIPELLSSFPRIRLDPDADAEISNDINEFIEVKFNMLSVDKHYPELLRVHVKEVFQNRAQGTFLWVGIVAKLMEKYKATEVEKALDLFPPGLDELYARMLLQIDIGRRDIAAKILRWVVMAVRPLTLSELSIAIDTTGSSSVGFSCDEVMRDQLSYCGHFLTIREDENEEISLIHQSAKDYLLRKTHDSNPELEVFCVKEEVVNLEIARKCLNYLQDGALVAGKVNLWMNTSHLTAFPLLSYAALHWPEHAKSLAPSEDIFDLSLSFYNRKSGILDSWLKTYWTVERYDDLPESFTLLHLASCFGIRPLAENLLCKGGLFNNWKLKLYLNKSDNKKRTALMWAAQGGHQAVVWLLLEKGADVNARNKYGKTALYEAVQHGHEAVVRLLLEEGADVNAKDKYGDAALIAATQGGHEAVVRLLLEKGADREAKNPFNGWTALHAAAVKGHMVVVRLLLEKGVDVNAKDRNGHAALYKAVLIGHEAMVRLLLEKGADVEAKDELGETALNKAARRGHEAVVRLLLEKVADVKAKNNNGETALYWATQNGHEAIEDGDVLAIHGAHDPVVRLLLEKGAEVEIKDASGGTVLYAATRGGHEAVVRLLLEKGADAEAKDASEETALYAAAHRGREALVRLLLEKGADVIAYDKVGATALFRAAESGHKAVVRPLLEKEARGGC
ncbi:hypothetical protein MMC22_010673 [Lobaria immixta]|nr:hypothetical protein [Lobaria immixta]